MNALPLYHPAYISLHREFETAVIAQGYSAGKNSTIHRSAREFLFFLETKKINDIKEVKTPDIIAYYEYLRERPNMRTEGGLSGSFINSQMVGIAHFFDHLLKTGKMEHSPARLPKFHYEKYQARYVLTEEEIKTVYTGAKNKLDKAILAYAYGCGLRRTEMSRLNVEDVLFQKGILNVREGKGHKSRSVPMTERIITDLKDYLINERPQNIKYDAYCPAFFLNNRGGRMNGETLNKKVKNMVKNTGDKLLMNKKISTHCLRHSIATHMMDRGADMNYVRKFLGHVCLDTTHIYSKRRKQRVKLYQLFSDHFLSHNITSL